MAFFYWYAGPAIKQLEVWWVKMLVYNIIPGLVTFIILYQVAGIGRLPGWHERVPCCYFLVRFWPAYCLPSESYSPWYGFCQFLFASALADGKSEGQCAWLFSF